MSRRRLVCYHEAGHAVVRWWLGHWTARAVVQTKEAFGAGGTIQDGPGRVIADEGAVFGYAIGDGAAFTQILNDLDHPYRYEPDWCEARVRMGMVEKYAGMYAEARHAKVGVLTCLVRSGGLDFEQARTAADAWFEDARRSAAAHNQAERIAAALVRSPKAWAAISAVAAALHGRGELGGAEIATLCAEAYGGEPAYDAWALRWPPTLEEIRSGFLPQREPGSAQNR